MKALVSACALCGLLWLPAAAQRGGGSGSFHGGSPVVSAGPRAAPGQGSRHSGGRGYGYGYPGFFGAGDVDRDAAYPPAPGPVLVLPAPAPPPQPPQPQVWDYTNTNPPETAQVPPAEFSVVGKDHVTHSAAAVWAQGGMLHFIDADGAGGQMALNAVDREATRQANLAKGLRLQVPAE